MRYKDLFIDFDDTLYDTHGNAVIALSETFEYFHLDRYFEDPQVFYDAYWKANIDLWTQYAKGEITRDYLIVERFKRPLMVSEKFRAEANSSLFTLHFSLKLSDKFLDFCASKPGVIDGAHELMDYLKQKGYRMHMCSNGFHEVQYKKLDACGLRNYFDTIILSEDAGVNKPSKDYFDYALKVSGANRETTLMIGDNLQSDILGALNAGLDAMLFNRWQVPSEELPQDLTFVVDNLCDIMEIL
jgi:putative hydrolase of the HAD superfamily